MVLSSKVIGVQAIMSQKERLHLGHVVRNRSRWSLFKERASTSENRCGWESWGRVERHWAMGCTALCKTPTASTLAMCMAWACLRHALLLRWRSGTEGISVIFYKLTSFIGWSWRFSSAPTLLSHSGRDLIRLCLDLDVVEGCCLCCVVCSPEFLDQENRQKGFAFSPGSVNISMSQQLLIWNTYCITHRIAEK